MDALGGAFSDYREKVYAARILAADATCPSPRRPLCRTALHFVDRASPSNRRDDGLYHTYNLLDFSADGRRRGRGSPAGDARGPGGRPQLGPAGSRGGPGTAREPVRQRPLPRGPAQLHAVPRAEAAGIPGEEHRSRRGRCGHSSVDRTWLTAGSTALLARDADGYLPLPRRLPQRRAIWPRPSTTSAVSPNGPRPCRGTARPFWSSSRTSSITGPTPAARVSCTPTRASGCIYWHMVAKLLLAVQEIVLRAEHEGQSRLRSGTAWPPCTSGSGRASATRRPLPNMGPSPPIPNLASGEQDSCVGSGALFTRHSPTTSTSQRWIPRDLNRALGEILQAAESAAVLGVRNFVIHPGPETRSPS